MTKLNKSLSTSKVDTSIYLMTDTSDGWSMATIDLSKCNFNKSISKIENDTYCLTVTKHLTKPVSWILMSSHIDNTIIDVSMGWILVYCNYSKIYRTMNAIQEKPVVIDLNDRESFAASYNYLKELNLYHHLNHCS